MNRWVCFTVHLAVMNIKGLLRVGVLFKYWNRHTALFFYNYHQHCLTCWVVINCYRNDQNWTSVLLRVLLPEPVTISRFQAGKQCVFNFAVPVWDSTLILCKSRFHNSLWCNLLFNGMCIPLAVLGLKKKKKKENRINIVILKISPSHSLLSLFTNKVFGCFVMFNCSFHPCCWCLALLVVRALFFPLCVTCCWSLCPLWRVRDTQLDAGTCPAVALGISSPVGVGSSYPKPGRRTRLLFDQWCWKTQT